MDKYILVHYYIKYTITTKFGLTKETFDGPFKLLLKLKPNIDFEAELKRNYANYQNTIPVNRYIKKCIAIAGPGTVKKVRRTKSFYLLIPGSPHPQNIIFKEKNTEFPDKIFECENETDARLLFEIEDF